MQSVAFCFRLESFYSIQSRLFRLSLFAIGLIFFAPQICDGDSGALVSVDPTKNGVAFRQVCSPKTQIAKVAFIFGSIDPNASGTNANSADIGTNKFGTNEFGANELEATEVEAWYTPAWKIPTSTALLIGIITTVVFVLIYLRERGRAPRSIRLLLASIRIAILGLILLMMLGWQRNAAIIDKPDLVIVIDTSASMQTVDGANSKSTDADQARGSRIEIAKQIVDANRIEQLREKYHVKLFRIDEQIRPVEITAADSQIENNASETYSESSIETRNGKVEPREDESSEAAKEQSTEQPPNELQTLHSLKAEGRMSRLGDGLIRVIKLQRGRPTSAIVLLSDGVNTAGRELKDAADLAQRRAIPFFAIGIGSPNPPRDIRLGELIVEKKVFVDDAVNVDVAVHASGYQDKSVQLQLKRTDTEETLAQTTVAIDGVSDVQQARLTFRPAAIGEIPLEIHALPLTNEVDSENNSLFETVTVHNETIRVLLVADYPNREFHFLKQLLSRSIDRDQETGSKSIELKTLLQQGNLQYASTDSTALRVFPVRSDELFEFDVVILCDARVGDVAGSGSLSNRDLQNLYDFVAARGKGVVVIAGRDNVLSDFSGTPAETLLPFDPKQVSIPDPNLDIDKPFSIQMSPIGRSWSPFQISERSEKNSSTWNQLPGFFWMAETSVLRPGTQALATHHTKTTDQGDLLPVISMQFVGAGKVVFHASPQTYRWRFRTGDRYFGRYWGQLIRYLSRSKLNDENQDVRLATDRDEFQSGDDVRVLLQFVDDRLAPEMDDAVKVALQKPGVGRETIFLQRESTERGRFQTTLSGLAPGEYQTWLIEPVFANAPRTRFRVALPQNETRRLQMNATGLRAACTMANGELYRVDQSDELFEKLPKGRSVKLSTLPPEPLWQKWYIVLPFALLLAALFTAEWIIRKWNWML